MRYLVKAFVTHETEAAVAEQAVKSGLFESSETLAGFVQGVCDENGVAELAKTGLTLSVSPMEAPPPPVDNSFALNTLSMRAGPGIGSAETMPGVRRSDGQPDYFLLRIPGGLSPVRKNAIAVAGINLLERDVADWYVAKLPNREAAFKLDFVTDVRLYDATETMAAPSLPADDQARSAALGIGPNGRLSLLYEATLHADADADAAVARLAAMGARVLARADRLLRIAPGTSDVRLIASLPEIAQLQPVRSAQLLDDFARTIVGLESHDEVAPAKLFDLTGEGELVGVADTGIDQTHPDFAGRIDTVIALGRPGDATDPSGHGTHVAGTILGDGSASQGRLSGMAPEARLHFQSLLDANGRLGGLPVDIKQLFQQAYDAGVRIHNNSWGAYLFARYGPNSIQTDHFVYEHPDFLPIIAAGNEGSCLPGAGGRPKGYVDYPSLAAPATAKNGLTVGASRSSRTSGGYSNMTWGEAWGTAFPDPPIRDDKISGDAEELAGFSSRGPCDYGTIKPDLTAPGTDIASTRSGSAPLRNFWGAYPGNPRYAFNGGTSMAAPVAAGCAALARQYYRRDRDHGPSAALLKATLINGTSAMSGGSATAAPKGLPNFDQGFGRLDLAASLPNASRPGMRLSFIDAPQTTSRVFVAQGDRHRWRLTLEEALELRICLVWTDPPGRGLQNGLRLLLDRGPLGQKWSSNNDMATLLNLIAPVSWHGLQIFTQRDSNNNVHIIRIKDAEPGDYTVTILADFMTTDRQNFACVLTGAIGKLVEIP